jgi:hypothetical protein
MFVLVLRVFIGGKFAIVESTLWGYEVALKCGVGFDG